MGGLPSSVINPGIEACEVMGSRRSSWQYSENKGYTNPNFDVEGWNEARLRRQSRKSFLTADVLAQESSRRRCDNVRHVSGQEFSRAHPHVAHTVPTLVLGRPNLNLRLQAAHASPNVCPFRQTFFDKLPAPVDELGATFHLQGLAPGQLVDFHLHKIWLGPMPLSFFFTAFSDAQPNHEQRQGASSCTLWRSQCGKSQSGWPAISRPKGPNHVL